MDEPYEIIAGKKRFTDKVEFVSEQAAHVAALKTDYISTDLDSGAEVATALNTVNTALNTVLDALEGLGRIKTS